MSKPIMEIEHVSKCYRIGATREPYLSLRDELARKAHRISSVFSRIVSKGQVQPSDNETDLWALSDVSFSVQEGEAVGIIGRNGAGKSTLLKILSRITPPTKGKITMRGRVASLLEVGTGFHPELTGRENIFLNGAILGMRREEIKRKFDEIVAFAEIEKFLDTPVKRYSSGMYVRLAFAVAAHLEPEILIVDEVLAVGDAGFQKKCMGKMDDTSKSGKTVLFVSHNMAAIRQLCVSGLLLSGGRVIAGGSADEAIDRYLRSFDAASPGAGGCLARSEKFDTTLRSFEIQNEKGELMASAEAGKPAVLTFRFEASRRIENLLMAVTVDSAEDVRVCALHTLVSGFDMKLEPPGATIRCVLPKVSLMPGPYRLTVKVRFGDEVLFFLQKALDLYVEPGDFFDTGRLPEKAWGGVALMAHQWSSSPLQ